VDWYLWRVLSSPKLNENFVSIRTMSLDDLADAHEVLDALEEAEALAQQ
jgi:hypothetical protein